MAYDAHLQDVRGESLDHERREMSEKRETTRADVRYAILCLPGDSASGRVKEDRLSHKNVA